MATTMSEPRDLFLHELGDILYAENVLVKALPKMAEEADDADLSTGFEEHLDETRKHVEVLEQVFETLGEKPKAEKCPGIEGIKKEHDEFFSEHDAAPEVADLFLAGAGARAEHYEIAAYSGSDHDGPCARRGRRGVAARARTSSRRRPRSASSRRLPSASARSLRQRRPDRDCQRREGSLAMSKTAREIMTTDCTCVGENDTIIQAAQQLARLNVGAMPICGEDNRLKGMLTDRDIVTKVLAEGKDPASTRAGEIGRGDGQTITIGADDSIEDALRTMSENQVRRLPVIDGHELVGIIAQADIARHYDETKVGELVEAISR